jgi:tRNA(fMet)-specific endonuclease VapC
MIVFDTDHVTLMEHANSLEGGRIRARLAATSEERATTIVTYEEQTRGWLGYAAKDRSLAHQVNAYRKLSRHLKLYCQLRILEFDERAAVEYQTLHRTHPRLGTMDRKIAAIVLAHAATLLTRNQQDFGHISGLKIEDWTA